MNRFICWLNTWRLSIPQYLRGSFAIEGHDYAEVFNDGNIGVLQCRRCGNQSASWHNQIDIHAPKIYEKGK